MSSILDAVTKDASRSGTIPGPAASSSPEGEPPSGGGSGRYRTAVLVVVLGVVAGGLASRLLGSGDPGADDMLSDNVVARAESKAPAAPSAPTVNGPAAQAPQAGAKPGPKAKGNEDGAMAKPAPAVPAPLVIPAPTKSAAVAKPAAPAAPVAAPVVAGAARAAAPVVAIAPPAPVAPPTVASVPPVPGAPTPPPAATKPPPTPEQLAKFYAALKKNELAAQAAAQGRAPTPDIAAHPLKPTARSAPVVAATAASSPVVAPVVPPVPAVAVASDPLATAGLEEKPEGAPEVSIMFVAWSSTRTSRIASMRVGTGPLSVVREGEYVEGMQVSAIHPEAVDFQWTGKKFRVPVREF